MGEPFPFRFPSNMPALTFKGLANVDRIGSTVTIQHWPATEQYGARRWVKLYHTTIAYIGERYVHFPEHGDHHQATREWLAQIVRDNHIGTSVYRNRKGELVIDGGQPLEGHTYAVR